LGKPLAILAIGILFVLIGCQSMFGSSVEETEHPHLYQGRSVTLLCRDGEPVQDTDIEPWSAAATCRDEYDEQRRSQTNATRMFILAGLGATVYGTVQVRKSRS
jgi:hypothetical protein